MKANEVLRILGITRQTLTRYVKEGKIRVKQLHNGRYDYNEEDVWKLAGKSKDERYNIIYARVSTRTQKSSLENQVKICEEFCNANGLVVHKIIKDIGSGIDLENRKGFMQLFDLIKGVKVANVIITYKDRLSRIGFEFLRKIFDSYGTKIIVVNESKYDDEILAEKEIFQELITIIHSFAMRLYSNRRKKLKLNYCIEELKHVANSKDN